MTERKLVMRAAADITLADVTTYLLAGLVPVRRRFTVAHRGLPFDIAFDNFDDAEKFYQVELERRTVSV